MMFTAVLQEGRVKEFESWLRANQIKAVLATIILWGSGAISWGVGGGWFITGRLLRGGGAMQSVTFMRALWGVRSR